MLITAASPQVICPVRETAAQALGSAAQGLPSNSLVTLMQHLTALVKQEEWAVRLAGLLGIKYVLAARLDQAGALLPAVLPAVLTGLKVRNSRLSLSTFCPQRGMPKIKWAAGHAECCGCPPGAGWCPAASCPISRADRSQGIRCLWTPPALLASTHATWQSHHRPSCQS